jgi:nucleotide-binding universal stress UspA family protein
MYSTILVPLDGSQLAECVLPHVETLVKGSQAKREIFARVVEPARR